jgi:hypothetical protein
MFKLHSHSASLECFLILQQNYTKPGFKGILPIHHNSIWVIITVVRLSSACCYLWLTKKWKSKVGPKNALFIFNKNCFVGLESMVCVSVTDFIYLLLQRTSLKTSFPLKSMIINQAVEFPIPKSLWLPLILHKSHVFFIRCNKSPKTLSAWDWERESMHPCAHVCMCQNYE